MIKGNQIGSQRKELVNSFPDSGSVRAKQAAAFLGIGLSTFWSYVNVKDGRIKQPVKLGARVSCWDAAYIREIAVNGFEQSLPNS